MEETQNSNDETTPAASGGENAAPVKRQRGHVKRVTTNIDMQKLKKLRKSLRLTQMELANLLGIHRTYLVLIEKGKKIPSLRLERAIQDFMDKAEKQDLSPTSVWRSAASPNASPIHLEIPPRKVPVVSWATAGLAKAYEDLCNHIDELVETDCKDQNAFAIIIEGDSMEDMFFAGDRVIFAPNLEPRNGDAVVAKLKDGRVYFKHFMRTGPEGSKVRLDSENENYSSMEFDRSEFEFVYPAWEVKRRLRR